MPHLMNVNAESHGTQHAMCPARLKTSSRIFRHNMGFQALFWHRPRSIITRYEEKQINSLYGMNKKTSFLKILQQKRCIMRSEEKNSYTLIFPC